MRTRDIIFLAATFAGMAGGVFLPELGEPLRHLPAVFIISQILLCFLSGTDPATPFERESLRGLPRFLFLKMLAVPLICWGVFLPFFPEYALGALLLGGAAVGVLAPFFVYLLRADEVFSTASVIASSLLMPFTVPLLVGLAALAEGTSTSGLWRAFLDTGLFLAGCQLLPFIAAKLLWKFRPGAAKGILGLRYGISVICATGAMLVIFSRFSTPLRQDPGLIPRCLGAACLLAALLFVLGCAAGVKAGRDRALSVVVGFCAMNSVLMAVVAAQFFGVHEVLMCALYSIPFNLLLIPYRLLASRLDAAGGALRAE